MGLIADYDQERDVLLVVREGVMIHKMACCDGDAGVLYGWGRDQAFVGVRLENARALGSRGWLGSGCRAHIPADIYQGVLEWLLEHEG